MHRTFLAALGLLLALGGPLSGQGMARTGDRVGPTPLRDIVLNDDGHRSLDDYLGRPVLIEWWGIR